MSRNFCFVAIMATALALVGCEGGGSEQSASTAPTSATAEGGQANIEINLTVYQTGEVDFSGELEQGELPELEIVPCDYDGGPREYWWADPELTGLRVWEVISQPVPLNREGQWLVKAIDVSADMLVDVDLCVYVPADTPPQAIAAALRVEFGSEASFRVHYPENEGGDITTEFLLIEEWDCCN